MLAATDPRAACEAFEQAMRASRSVSSNFHVALALVEWVALKRQLGETELAVSGVLDLLDMLVAVFGQPFADVLQTLREAGLLLADADRRTEAALAMLASAGCPRCRRADSRMSRKRLGGLNWRPLSHLSGPSSKSAPRR